MYRLFSLAFALTPLFATMLFAGPPQATSVGAARDARVSPDEDANLAFGGDGKNLYAIGKSRAIAYAADTGAVASAINLPPDIKVLSITSDGGNALINAGVSGDHARLFMFDTHTGRQQEIPSSWYVAGPDAFAAISGDGRLVSIYDVSGSVSTTPPMIVRVYDWPEKTLVVEKLSEIFSDHGMNTGGVTADGAIEFINDRAGRKIFNLKTGYMIGQFSYNSVRSLDGKWAVEFPNLSLDESAPKDVLLKEGATGKTRSKLDAGLEDYEADGSITGAFCGTTGRFILGRGKAVEVYAIPSGRLLASFPTASWRGANADETDRVTVACSPTGTRVAVLSGARLTFHDLK